MAKFGCWSLVMFMACGGEPSLCPPGTVLSADETICEIVDGGMSATDAPCPAECPWTCYGNEQVRVCEDLTQISAGDGHVCGLTERGNVYCWGQDDYGQLGDGEQEMFANRPMAAPILGNATQIDVGGNTSCAVVGGEVFCWGAAFAAVEGATTTVVRPTRIAGLTGVLQVAVGDGHACALHGGNVSCWGDNYYGQVGTGERRNDVPNPTQVVGLSGVSALSVNGVRNCAIQSGEVWCWGSNARGSLGVLDAGSDVVSPGKIPGLTNVTQISVGAYHLCAVDTAGALSCWGRNEEGQLGIGTFSEVEQTVHAVTVPERVSGVAAGWTQTCAWTNERLFCWGSNRSGEAGNSDTNSDLAQPTEVTSTRPGRSVALARDLSCLVTESGEGRCWGSDAQGRLGDGNDDGNSSAVVEDRFLTGVQQVALGGTTAELACAATFEDVLCWGQNEHAEVGTGMMSPVVRSPIRVDRLGQASQVVVGASHACALLAGEVSCWGARIPAGLAGDAAFVRPTRVPGLLGVTQLWGNNTATFNGELVRWTESGVSPVADLMGTGALSGVGGDCYVRGNQLYCFADPGFSGEQHPVSVSPPSVVARGAAHWCAVASGRVHCWGANSSGELGQGMTTLEPIQEPTMVPGMEQVTSLVAGSSHTCALRGGQVYCWGSNTSGQSGHPSQGLVVRPTQVPNLENIVALAAVGARSCAVSAGGRLYCWGKANLNGAVGFRPDPVTVRRPLDR